jgi:penicillin G amidase
MRLIRLLAGFFSVVLFVITLPIVVIGAMFWLTLLPPGRDVHIQGLSAPVDITYDQDGIPRIRAATMQDAAAALGYVHARDRMFEMELMRRAASGRLSELAGISTLRIDETMRILGLRRRAEADYQLLPPETQGMLEAYARGVNAWIADRGRFAAPEFIPLGAPQAWQPVDSLLWGETMGLWLSENWRTELTRASLASKLAPDQINELWPTENTPGDFAAAAGLVLDAALARRVLEELPHFPGPFTLPETASNEWAVDGSHTASGKPLLADDPHLAFGFPSLWYLARIDTPDQTLAGAFAPGVPFLVLGHNRDIAWSFTTTGADVQDVFQETVLPDGTYQTPEGPMPFVVHREVIRVRGHPDVVFEARETRHGPVISDLDHPGRTATPGAPPGQVLAVEMANLAPGNTSAAGLLALNQAKSVEQAGLAAALISTPVQNMLVADHQTIGLFTTGRVPIRKSGDGSAPVPGADGAHDWIGYASGDQLPHIVSPPSGRLVNANERVAGPDFPVFMGKDWFGDWRARRINQMLDGNNHLTTADFALMEVDVTSTFAQQLLPTLLQVQAPPGLAAKAVALLKGWDARMVIDQPQPLIFNAWIQRFYQLLMQQAGIAGEWGGPWMEFTAWVLTPAGAHWCGGDCGPVLAKALQESTDALAARLGPNPAAWRWGDVHKAIFAHPILQAIPLLRRLGTISIAAPGDDSTVFRGGAPVGDLQSRHGPEFRGVYDLSNLDASLFMMVPGQSGNLLNRHARDFLLRWRDGATVTLGPTPDRIERRMRLVP